MPGKIDERLVRRHLPLRPVLAFRIDEDVGVERYTHASSVIVKFVPGSMDLWEDRRPSRFVDVTHSAAFAAARGSDSASMGASLATGRPWEVTTKLRPAPTSRSSLEKLRLASAAETVSPG